MGRELAKPAARGPVEERWELPQGWKWYRAADFARIVGGSTPKNAEDTTNFDPSGVPWITPADLSGYARATIASGRRNLSKHVVKLNSLLPRGSVLISSRAPIGYCVVAENPLATNQGFRSLILNTGIDPLYIRYYIIYSKSYLELHASGTTFKELSGSAMASLAFPIPPLNVQRSIVARIDELFIDLDDGEAALARARADLGTWRKALLKAAVTGELTADWRAANPSTDTGGDLLARILDERRARWIGEPRNKGKCYVEAAAMISTCNTKRPSRWTSATIEQISFIENGQTPKGIELQTSHDALIPWFKVSSMNMPGNESELVHSNWYLEPAQAASIGLKTHPKGTIVFPKRGGSIFTEKKRILSQESAIDLNLMGVLPLPSSADHLWLFFQNLSLGSISDGSNVPQINYPDVATLETWLPPKGEIVEITFRLKAALQLYGDAEKDILQSTSASSTLRQSILAAAFRGELVA